MAQAWQFRVPSGQPGLDAMDRWRQTTAGPGQKGRLLFLYFQSFIYVEPVYLIAENADIPQLKRIIVSDGKRLAMEPTLSEALHSVFSEEEKRVSAEPGFAESRRSTQARDALAEAEAALRDGDWDAFGRAMQSLKKLLGE